MAYTGQQFDPWNQPESVHVHQALNEQHRENDESDMPLLSHVVWVIQYHQTLKDYGRDIGYPRKK